MLRCGIIGLGNIALNGHVPSYLHDNFIQKEIKIAAGADLILDNCNKFKKIFPEITLYSTYEELLDNESLDFIDICTPPNTHKSIIQKAVNKGIHILCEKPIANDLDEAIEIKRLIFSRDIVFLPCHQYYFSPSWQAIKEVINKDKIGKIHFAQAQIFRIRANEGNIHWNPSWRIEKDKSGGGILIDHGAHLMYLFTSIMGKPVKIYANVKKLLHKHYEVEDTACVILEFSDCLIEFILTWAGHSRRIVYRFLGDKGELYVGEDHISIKYRDGREEKEIFDTGMSHDSSHSLWFTPLIKLLVQRIKHKDYRKDGIEEALLCFKYISMAYESSIQGKTLSVE
ncbi:MAG: Gfo/Idh/MocA family oxidoreductase [Candidatus Firestonebacteria bacterium]|nr:Gfo/Idh/MocA family oxidoreductase [Candidatus Firestonebacteria bacterium]